MPISSIGKVTVSTAGTPVQVTSTITDCQAISIQALAANTGKIYVGLKNMNKTTLVGVVAVLAVPTTNIIPSFNAYQPQIAGLNADAFYVDADVSSEGVLVAFLIG